MCLHLAKRDPSIGTKYSARLVVITILGHDSYHFPPRNKAFPNPYSNPRIDDHNLHSFKKLL